VKSAGVRKTKQTRQRNRRAAAFMARNNFLSASATWRARGGMAKNASGKHGAITAATRWRGARTRQHSAAKRRHGSAAERQMQREHQPVKVAAKAAKLYVVGLLGWRTYTCWLMAAGGRKGVFLNYR
jgi:hypothetical protein